MGKHVRLTAVDEAAPSSLAAAARPKRTDRAKSDPKAGADAPASKPKDVALAAVASDIEPVNDTNELVISAQTLLSQLMRSVKATLASGAGNASLVREGAALARAIASMAGEQRAREKMRLQHLRSIDHAMVLEYIRYADEATRREIAQAIEDLDPRAARRSYIG